MEALKNYIKKKFGIDEKKFLDVLEKSPGAESVNYHFTQTCIIFATNV